MSADANVVAIETASRKSYVRQVANDVRPRASAARLTYSGGVKFWRDKSGQGVLEYGLILGLVAMVAIGALLVLGSGSNSALFRAGHTIGDDPASASVNSGNANGGQNQTAARTAPH